MYVLRDELLKHFAERKRAVVGRASKWQTKNYVTKIDENDGDDMRFLLILLIVRTEEPIEDVTTTRRF